MIAALAANTPEISSAVTALFFGQHDVGVGIIIGSSIFNLAALLGLSALIAGRLIVRRQGVIFNGAASLMVILALVLLVFKFISAPRVQKPHPKQLSAKIGEFFYLLECNHPENSGVDRWGGTFWQTSSKFF